MSRAASQPDEHGHDPKPLQQGARSWPRHSVDHVHAWANQKDWVRGVSTRIIMRKRRNGQGPRMRVLRAMG